MVASSSEIWEERCFCLGISRPPGGQYLETYPVQDYVAWHLRKQRATAQELHIVFNNRPLSPRLCSNRLMREVHGAESSTSIMVTKFKFLERGCIGS